MVRQILFIHEYLNLDPHGFDSLFMSHIVVSLNDLVSLVIFQRVIVLDGSIHFFISHTVVSLRSLISFLMSYADVPLIGLSL